MSTTGNPAATGRATQPTTSRYSSGGEVSDNDLSYGTMYDSAKTDVDVVQNAAHDSRQNPTQNVLQHVPQSTVQNTVQNTADVSPQNTAANAVHHPLQAAEHSVPNAAQGVAKGTGPTTPHSSVAGHMISAKSQNTQDAMPPNTPPLGLDGYCPVTLRTESRWVAGDRRWGAIHQGHTYLFVGPQQQQQFLANPNEYSPVLSGADAVLAIDTGQQVEGHRRHGVVYENRVFLFSNETSLQRFLQNPKRYAQGVRQAQRVPIDRTAPK